MHLVHPTVEPWCVPGPGGCRVTLFVDTGGAGEPVAVFARQEPDNEESLVPMRRRGGGEATRPPGAGPGADAPATGPMAFEALLPWDGANEPMVYCFKVLHGGAQHWLAADGLHPLQPPRDVHFRVSADPARRPPDWVPDQVFYQIFPDRFCQGDPSLAVRTGEYVYGDGRWPVVRKAWGEPVDPALPVTAFYGGDLPGVLARLDYLQRELGVTAIWLNPIFTSGSNHRYDTEDYEHVDPHLGGDAALRALREATAARGMRLVLDGVVNHTGERHPWVERDAQARAWYVWTAAGRPAGWKGHRSLPVLDFSAAGVCDAVYGSEQAVLRRWLRPPWSIDGWRLDVVHMLGEGPGALNNAGHVAALRRAIKAENPQAYVLGEHFNEATRWLQGDQEDGAMNYFGFTQPVRAWLAGVDIAGQPAGLDAGAFGRALVAAMARIPWAQQLAQLNLLDSHDTPRLLTLLKGDRARMKLAVTLLCTWPGVPSLYYGDEIGLEGDGDPDCRRCFDWDRAHWDEALWQHVRAAIARRQARIELRRGAVQVLHAQGDVFAFARYTADALTVVAVNRGPACTLRLPLASLPLDGLSGAGGAGASRGHASGARPRSNGGGWRWHDPLPPGDVPLASTTSATWHADRA